nr:retrovirus-related Pol polyprotein from transposon TNT 1-94 [Tanacetum cinerariifolium]
MNLYSKNNPNYRNVGTPSTGSGNLYCQWELSPGSGNALCILFPTGLPSKCFENDHTYSACLKGKQHKASLTDDFSRFTWTFFLKTKDETSGILRKFITEIENLKDLKDLKVKIIRVFNKRTNKVEENLHVEFLENKAIEKCTKDAASQKVKKDVSSLRYIALPNWVHDALLESSSSKTQDDCSIDVPKSSRNSNPTATSTNPPANQMGTLTVETPIPTVSSPVPIPCFTDSQEPSSDTRLISKRVANQVETPSLDNILTLTNRFEDILRVTTNSDESNGVEVDVSNMETTITASPTPTLRIHKDHPKSQIIGPVDTLIQTRNKFKEDARGIIIRNKARLVAQGHIQEEGIDDDEVFAPVARIEAFKLFLAYASFMSFTVYQIDVKSAFLYGTIDEEVGTIDQTIFIIRQRGDFILVQVYMDDIIFGSSNPQLCREIKALMHEKFQMSAMAYSDSDYGGATQDRKSTTGGCQFFGRRLISWQCKKQTIVATSTTEAEYVVTASGCGQVLWIQNQLIDYGDYFEKKLISVDHIHTDGNVADLLTKPFDARSFQYLVSEHNVDFHPIVDFVEASPLSPSFSGRIVPLFDTMLVPQGEGSGIPTEPHHTPSPEAQQTSPTTHSSPTLPLVTTAPIPTVTPSDTPHLRKYTRRARIAQSSALPHVADEPVSPLGDGSQGEAYPTDSGLAADQDRENIDKTSSLPSDSTPRVTSPAADEGSMQQKLNELTALCTSLQRQHSDMAAKFEAQDLEINREEAAERVSDDTKEMATVFTSMDATTVLSSGVAEVPTGSGSIPTAGPPTTEVPTVVMWFPLLLEEEMEREAQRMNEQISKDAKIARIHDEEELQIMIDGLDRSNETVAKYQDNYAKVYKYQSQQRKPLTKKHQREFYTLVLRNQAGWKAKDFKGMTLEETKENFDLVWKQIYDFIPIGSKEEAERFKRKGIRFEQESVKKLKTSEEVKATEEVPEDKVKGMMQLVPVEEIYVKALQVKDPIIDWKNMMHAPVEWKLYDSCRVHHVTSKDNEIFMLIEKDYPLRKGLVIVMISYKIQVENYSQMANDLILKIYKITNSGASSLGEDCWNKMHKAFPLPVIEFPLAEEVPTASEESSHCQKKRDATAEKITLLLKLSSNCQSKSYDSYAKYVVSTSRVVVPTGRYVVPAGNVIVVSTGRLSVIPTGRVLSPEYWITNSDMNIWKVTQNGNNLKRTRRDRDGRVIILPPTTADEHIIVQRESKAITTLLQSIPDDRVADFHYMDDARDIWNAVKARFGGNAKSKKMRKSMLKQEFSEFRIGEAEGLHKGALPSSWSQVALTLKTKGGLELLSFDELYYKLKTLEVDVKGYTTFFSIQSAGPSHFAFVSTTSASKKLSYGDSPSYSSTTTYTAPSNSKTGSHRSRNVIKDVLHYFVTDTEPEYNTPYFWVIDIVNKVTMYLLYFTRLL